MAFPWPWQRKSNITDILRALGGASSAKSGAKVTHETALQVTTALACGRVIAEGLAQVPCKVLQETPNGGREAAKDHSLYDVLAISPNPWQTSYEFREMMGMHLVFAGNFFALKNIVRGKIVELFPYEPGQVTVKRDNGIDITYAVRLKNGDSIDIPAENMWHVRGPSWNGWMGLDAVKLIREAIGLSLATEEHGARMFSNGARVGGTLTTDGALKPAQVDELRAAWKETQGGNANAYETAILWGGLKWTPIAQQNDQAQLIEQRMFQVQEICRGFRVMPIMVGHADKAQTYASSEQQFLAHVVHTMGPWYERVEQSAEVNLLSEKDRKAGYYVKFITAGLLRGAHQARSEYYAKALGAGGSPAWMTADEVRGLEELNPMGGAASELPKPTNVGGFGKPEMIPPV